MTDAPVPEKICVIDGCSEPAAVTPRSPTTSSVVEAPEGEIIPLCADHAEQADAPEVPPPPPPP